VPKRKAEVDVLKEIRRALRALRRAERSIVQAEPTRRRLDAKFAERAELQELARQARRGAAALAV